MTIRSVSILKEKTGKKKLFKKKSRIDRSLF